MGVALVAETSRSRRHGVTGLLRVQLNGWPHGSRTQ